MLPTSLALPWPILASDDRLTRKAFQAFESQYAPMPLCPCCHKQN